jgi:hypothetical protein
MSSSQLTNSVVEVFVNNKANSSLHELTSASANNEGEQEDFASIADSLRT